MALQLRDHDGSGGMNDKQEPLAPRDRRLRTEREICATRQINSSRKEAGRLWQGRFFDRALRTVREYNRAVEYIHLNPVRRGLVAKPEDWFWSSVREYSGSLQDEAKRHPFLPIDRVLLPSDERTRI